MEGNKGKYKRGEKPKTKSKNKKKNPQETTPDTLTGGEKIKNAKDQVPKYLTEFGLNYQQYLFCMYYIAGNNGKQSALKAGYKEKSAVVSASKMLSKKKILAAMQRIRDRRLEAINANLQIKQVEIDQDNVLKRLASIAFLDPLNIHEKKEGIILESHMVYDKETKKYEERLYEKKIHNPILPIHEWPAEARYAMKKIAVDGKSGKISHVEFYDKLDAIKLLGSWLQDMFGRGKGDGELDASDKANKVKELIQAISGSIPTAGIRLVK